MRPKNSTKDYKEYNKFNVFMGNLLKVPHDDIKAKLEAEKQEKAKKRKTKKPSA